MEQGQANSRRAARLLAFAGEIADMAREIERGAEREPAAGALQHGDGRVADDATLARRARHAYNERRRREKLFGTDLFGEPAWDILLDMFIAERSGKTVSVSSVCIGACVPATTALRWIALLEAEQMIVRTKDPADARRAFLTLTERPNALLTEYFGGAPGATASSPATPSESAGEGEAES